jgi:hypothetical protein
MANKTTKIIFCIFVIILAAFLVKFALSKKVIEGHGIGCHGLGGCRGLGWGHSGRGVSYYGGYGGRGASYYGGYNPLYIYDDYEYDNYYSPYYYRRAHYPLYY